VRVLVTGSKGFVGTWLVAHLESCGDQVTGLDTDVDVTDRGAVLNAVVTSRPDAVCHLAAQTSVATSWTERSATYHVNLMGALHVLDAAAQCPRPPRVLLVGSAEVYGRVTTADLPVGEDHPFAPVSPYAASKAAAEMVGLQAWLGGSLEVVRARPFNHTGPGQRPDFVVPALAKQVAAAVAAGGGSLHAGNLDVKRDITDVRDVVRAYRLLLERGAPGEAYNVCRGTAVSVAELAERLLALAGVTLAVVVDPERLRPVDVPELRGDPTKLTKATGWVPQVPIDETLADVLAYWQRPVA
jgi:GDP-4-dehydro-6-deoxy-D-mannose reductase